ncbi:MAG: Flagellar basal body P-ring formation protein FlgA [Candidatus Tokpelaia hoelldobleri]|uniref:Flagella basal body P-ring formation protein FlgA n=1 Tax=Candidatus Tokpelaia hoelldobleri TaxID=1902579 RepID=A0A1U9JSW0_9HYPH|nr:MAG: Flagellar basal body P-ring formation protein FlgA [Candidatus Tokpelaia hoelldoblerii]
MGRLLFLALCLLSFLAFGSSAQAGRVDFVVPLVTVYPGQPLGDVAISRKGFFIREEAASLYVVDSSQLLNKIARGTLPAGRPIKVSMLGDPVLVKRGQMARLVFTSGDLVITAMGMAMEAGSVGDFIKVRNTDSGLVINGTVLDDGSVRVGGR